MTNEVSAVEQQAQRIREAVMKRHGLRPGEAVPARPSDSALVEMQRLASVSAHWGIASDLPVVGGLLVLIRRVLRLTLRWYVNPIVEQQNRFNQATLRALHELQVENESLRTELSRYVEANERREP